MADRADGGPASLRAVHRIRPAYEQVADQIRALIVEGDLTPGDRLPSEGEVASAFGVSRGTVREAIRILTAANLLYSVRGAHGGTFVTRTDPSVLRDHLETGLGILSGTDAISLDELLDTRMLLEVPAARLAAQRRTDEQLVALREAVEAAPPDADVRYQHHRRFHTELLEASGNRLLQLVTAPVFGVIRSRFVIPPSRRKIWGEIEADHEEILGLVEAGDGDGAAEAMRRHLVRLNAFYQSMGPRPQAPARRGPIFPVR
ncbi:FadR/GntR family transcriptional regulator [Pseudonocardia kongjuensis]|uniref:FadR/GntR family transcriptional regulator n=1 Tax=Pseudonocardia kongjuensis TaxID=102227 RepID=A0ABN1YBV5_9PSEU